MHRKWKGYFTVEASFVMPIVLFLYLLIILVALFLYCRCAISQDNFLLAMRGAEFTKAEENYGEIIYGEAGSSQWQAEPYVQERLNLKRKYYPFFPSAGGSYEENGKSVFVQTAQKGSGLPITKEVQKLNPVEVIREGRKN